MSLVTFNTLGSAYTAPTHDHKYHIKHGLPFGTKERSKKEKTYMNLIVDRAKVSVDPRKYTPQNNWHQMSKERPNLGLPRAKRMTFTSEIMTEKKKIPGPSDFKKMDPYKPKIFGFYSYSQERITSMQEHAEDKQSIPASSKYESRGKSMSDILKEKAAKYLQAQKSDGDRIKSI